MASSQTNRRAGIILQYGQMALHILVNLIYTPIMLRLLGQSEYGIYNLASSIISYLSLLSLGFGAGYIRFYSKYKAKDDQDGIKRLNGLYMLVFSILGAVALVAGLVVSFNVKVFFNDTYSISELKIAKTLMLFLTFNLAISFPASVFSSYISSQEKFIFQKLINIGKTVVSPCLCIVLLLCGYGSIGMVMVTTAMSLIVDFINIFYCVTKLKMRFSFRNFDKSLFKEIAVFSVFIAMNQIIDQINWQTDKVILGKMINGAAVAIYAVASTINNMYLQFSTAISGVFAPQIHRIIQNPNVEENEKNQQLTDLFIKVGRIQFMILGLILTGFIFFGKYFVIKWAGSGYVDAYYIALLLICPATIALCQNIGIEIQRARNKHQFRSLVCFIMALLNIGISIYLTSKWGYIGAAIGTTTSLVVANGVIMNIYYHKKLKIDVVKFWKNILNIFIAMLLPISVAILSLYFIKITNIWIFIAGVVIYALLYLCSMFLAMNPYERDLIKQLLQKLKRKKKMDVTSTKSQCCGCGACAQICPQKCISMVEDSEGFLYPVIDKTKCVNCGLCEKVCSIKKPKDTIEQVKNAYFAYLKDDKIRINSASGAMFYSLAKYILDNNGVVFGAAYDSDFNVKHIKINSSKDLKKLQGSKYTQSIIGDSYLQVKEELLMGKKVLFSGTACQIAGLKSFLDKDYNNLILVDILCHGVPSPRVLKKYIAEMEKKYNSKLKAINFRNKKTGWSNYSVVLTFANGTEVIEIRTNNIYMNLFLKDICLRPSCHDCKFKDMNRDSDITLGDAWGIQQTMPEMDDDKGTSVVCVHSSKGKELLEKIKKDVVLKEIELDVAISPLADSRNSVKAHRNREKFFKKLNKNVNVTKLEKLTKDPFMIRVKRKIKSKISRIKPINYIYKKFKKK